MTARFRQHRFPSGGVALGLRLGLPQPLAVRLSRLRTPERIQDFVNSLRWNLEGAGPTARSVAVDCAACVVNARRAEASASIPESRMPAMVDSVLPAVAEP